MFRLLNKLCRLGRENEELKEDYERFLMWKKRIVYINICEYLFFKLDVRFFIVYFYNES